MPRHTSPPFEVHSSLKRNHYHSPMSRAKSLKEAHVSNRELLAKLIKLRKNQSHQDFVRRLICQRMPNKLAQDFLATCPTPDRIISSRPKSVNVQARTLTSSQSLSLPCCSPKIRSPTPITLRPKLIAVRRLERVWTISNTA
jgi:hypothetical protein